MLIEQIHTECLSQGSYYIESNGEAAIIDPLREIDSYIEKAKKNNVRIKYIFETHFHADFVSGHLSLSKSIGAPIIFGPNASTSFESIIAKDGEVFNPEWNKTMSQEDLRAYNDALEATGTANADKTAAVDDMPF